MITDNAGRTSPLDGTSAAKPEKGGRNTEGGSDFSLTLSNLERKDPQQRNDAGTGEGRPASVEERLGAAGQGEDGRMRPLIDLRPDTLRRQSAAGENALRGAPAGNAEEGEAARKSVGNGFSLPSVAQGPQSAKSSRQKAEADEDATSEAAAPEKPETDIPPTAVLADMLSLLAGGEHLMAAEAAGLGMSRPGGTANATTTRRGSIAMEDGAAGGVGPRREKAQAETSELLSMPSSDQAGVDRDRLFRFSNARGGQTVDMSVAGGRGEKAAIEFKNSTGASAENITVLDSRRFLGLAPNSNSALLTSALSGDPEWVSAMQPSSGLSDVAGHGSTGGVVNTLKLQMNPHELGAVTATLRLAGDELSVHLTVETRAAYRQLSEDSGGILDALRAQGFAVDQVTVSVVSTADTDANKGQQSGGQAGQSMTANGERQQDAQGRGQGPANERGARETTGNGNEVVSENAAAGIPGSARPGQLYL